MAIEVAKLSRIGCIHPFPNGQASDQQIRLGSLVTSRLIDSPRLAAVSSRFHNPRSATASRLRCTQLRFPFRGVSEARIRPRKCLDAGMTNDEWFSLPVNWSSNWYSHFPLLFSIVPMSVIHAWNLSSGSAISSRRVSMRRPSTIWTSIGLPSASSLGSDSSVRLVMGSLSSPA